MAEAKIITSENKADVNIKNDGFTVFGRFIPSLENGVWKYEQELFEKSFEMCFPDENYDFEKMSKDHVFIGAYDNGKCIGLAVLRHAFFKHMYLYDLKVNRDFRNKGVGKTLISASFGEAKKLGYNGIYAICQDNNLSGCRFYVRCGFRIGGADTEVYKGTSQEGKTDIVFYLG